MYELRSTVEPIPGDARGEGDDPGELTSTAPTYDAALAILRDQVPPGWRLTGLRTDYDRVLDHLHGRRSRR